MRAGFEYYRALPQDAIENQNYSKTKLTMPLECRHWPKMSEVYKFQTQVIGFQKSGQTL